MFCKDAIAVSSFRSLRSSWHCLTLWTPCATWHFCQVIKKAIPGPMHRLVMEPLQVAALNTAAVLPWTLQQCFPGYCSSAAQDTAAGQPWFGDVAFAVCLWMFILNLNKWRLRQSRVELTSFLKLWSKEVNPWNAIGPAQTNSGPEE